MEKAHWNGKIVFASDIYQVFENEKKIREASKNKELRCIDPDCREPILKYKHGDIQAPHFAHIRKDYTCDYDSYENENTSAINKIKNKLFQSLTQKGFSVEEGVKILPHHYTHLLVTLDNKKIAIEIGSKHTSYSKTETLTKQYQERGIKIIWITVDNNLAIQSEKYYGQIKRYIINTSKNKDLIVISEDGNNVIQSKEDTNFYKFISQNYPKILSKEGTIEDLTFEETELTLPNFINEYENWFQRKQRAYHKKIAETNEQQKQKYNISEPIKKEIPVLKPQVGTWINHPDLGSSLITEVKEENNILIDIITNDGQHYTSVWNELCRRPKFKILHTPYK